MVFGAAGKLLLKWSAIGFLLAFGIPVAAQCPDNITLKSKTDDIARYADRQQAIRNLKILARQRSDCGSVNDSSFAYLMHTIGRVHWSEYELDSAAFYTKRAISINSSKARSVKRADLANSYYNLALVCMERNELDGALSLLDTAGVIASEFSGKKFMIANVYSLQANILTALGNYEQAILNAEAGYSVALKENNRDLMVKNLLEKAQASLYMKRHSDAESILEKALPLIDKDNYTRLGPVYSLMAENAIALRHFEVVVPYYKKAFQNYKLLGDDVGCGQVAASLGYYYRINLRQFEMAKKEYTVALDHLRNPAVRAIVYNDFSEVYRESGNYVQSLQMKQLALLESGLVNREATFEANPVYESIRPVLDKTSLLEIVQDKAYAWSEFAKVSGNKRERLNHALKTYMLADTMIDHMRWEHSGNLTKLFWREKTKSMYERAIETCYLLGDTEKAFYFLEKSKAVLLSDQLQELGAAHLLSEPDRRKEQDLRTKVAEWQSKLETVTDTAVTSARAGLFAAQEQLDSFIKSLEKTNPLYYAYKYDNKVSSVSDLRGSILENGQTLLSYFVGDSAVYGLAVGPGKAVLKRLDLAEYNLLTNTFQRLISDRNTQNSNFGEYLRVSSALYKLLVAPFEISEGARVVISPDGSFLPFSALSRSDSRPDFLVNHYAVSYTYSAVVLGKMQRKSTGSGFSPGFFGMAPVQFAVSLDQAPLTGSDQALRNIDRYFFRSRVATGQDASRAEFVNSSPGYRIVQLFTHASADSSGSIPMLYFADSTLRLNELSLPRKPLTELLILSACQTGVGKNQRGEGVFSLARGFAALGIPSVLTTLWSVENEPVYQITQNLYNQLSDDMPLDIALQNAQKQWLQTASKHGQLPYAWAGMVIVGNTEPVGTGVPPRKAWLFLGLTLSFAAGTFFFRRKRKTS